MTYCTEERRHPISDEKCLVIVQVCLRCKREFPFKRSRKKCPKCQGLLRNKMLIIKLAK